MACRTQPPIAVDILSDDDDGDNDGDDDGDTLVDGFVPDSFSPRRRKKAVGRRGVSPPPPPPPPPPTSQPLSVLILVDDDPTPQKKPSLESSTPCFVPETPMTPSSDPVILRCSRRLLGDITAGKKSDKYLGINKFICLESDDEETRGQSGEESPRVEMATTEIEGENEVGDSGNVETSNSDDIMKCGGPPYEGVDRDCLNATLTVGNGGLPVVHSVGDSPLHRNSKSLREDMIPQHQTECSHYEDDIALEHMVGTKRTSGNCLPDNSEKSRIRDERMARKKQLREEKGRLNEEKKRKRQEERLAKEVMKAEAAEMKKLHREKQKWEKGKFALKCIVAEIDAKVVENGSVGGHLLTRFAEKGLSFRITSNPIERSILWKMNVPDELSQLSLMGSEVRYVLLVYEAEEFCSLVRNGVLLDHVCRVQSCYPSFTVCYLTNRLMSYISKWEQSQYKSKSNDDFFVRPPVEEVLSKLTTHFTGVHSRLCMDEADVADHIVGLTCSLATCQFRKKITRLSVNANGSLVSKDFIDRRLIKGNVWLKALVAIPKVQPRFAVAIWKRYPTMRSLLDVYMDPSKPVYEKEFLLQGLPVEGLLGGEGRRLGEACSKRVYRVLMAQNGAVTTDDAEDGADFFAL